MKTVQNAKIIKTMLGYEDHGLLTCWIQLDFGGAGQGFGGYNFTGNNDFGIKFIQAILEMAGANSWEDLVGRVVRVEGDAGRIYRFGHFLEDKWFDPAELAKKYVKN